MSEDKKVTYVEMDLNINLVKSHLCVDDYRNVFTQSWKVDDMLNLVNLEMKRIVHLHLEFACRVGVIFIKVLFRELQNVKDVFKQKVPLLP